MGDVLVVLAPDLDRVIEFHRQFIGSCLAEEKLNPGRYACPCLSASWLPLEPAGGQTGEAPRNDLAYGVLPLLCDVC